jgi:excisionase family DNA binding protein
VTVVGMAKKHGADLPARPTIKQAAEFHGVDPKTIRRWIAQGLLTAHRVGPRLLRLDRGEVLALGRKIGGSSVSIRTFSGTHDFHPTVLADTDAREQGTDERIVKDIDSDRNTSATGPPTARTGGCPRFPAAARGAYYAAGAPDGPMNKGNTT